MSLALDILPKKLRHFEWADFIELRCITSQDGEFSQEDLRDLIFDEEDFAEDNERPVQTEEDVGPQEITDRQAAQIADRFAHLHTRANTLRDKYPFEISEDQTLLSLRSELTSTHKQYVFLLLCANTRVLKSNSDKFTSNFERICLIALEGLLPKTAIRYSFGASTSKRYSGTLYKKLRMLANDIGGKMVSSENDFNQGNSGDGGLDIVAWIPVSGINTNRLIYFCQCSCSMDDWVKKQSDASYNRQSMHMNYSAKNVNIMFVPFYNIRTDGYFAVKPNKDVVFMDRLRILDCIPIKSPKAEIKDCVNLVEKILKIRRSV